ncbi:hypothetical protein HW130_21620 [Streptomyces sp. PKU-EA00015]|uniref:DUF6571 family protein n=1 Tax=Streptomyces sp. PKU-EA00015 TaxID=2748326 RepID=UPI0015A1E0CB|nr:DUF6571 family protein [Streptomyces sp. PKU-EA00015]NWF28827.1 hypothetical protein [Streptomyces sp. PKU-EA00015]
MDFDALHSANFKLLDDTVSDWTSMLTKLETLKKDAEDGLHGQAKKANWAGYNATVSREFIGKTAGEFGDAVTQATSIRNIMRDTRDELKTQQRLLKEAIDRGRGKNLTVTANGGGFTVRENPDKKAPGGQADLDALRDELQGILNKATEIDSTASTSLKALVDLTDYGFSDANYNNRDEAANAVKEAERLAALAKKKPEDMTPADFDALKSGLEKYSGDEIFSEHFATTLGPQGTLNFWAGLNDPHAAYKVGRERVDQYDDLQKALSLTLATATQADSPEMSRWKYEMVNLGDQPISKNSTTMGFQVMSNLMRWGDYDDRFLNDYGSKLIETEKKMTDNGRHMPRGWQHMGMDPLLNRTGTDSGSDPMTGFLKALSNSPDAATEFFNGDFVTKDEDHDFEEDADGNGKNEKRELSNFDYLFEERDWPEERDDKGEDSIEGRNNLAMALEAATTGHPAGEMPTEDTPPHNPDQARLMSDLVASISEDPKRLTDHAHMSDSVGQITSEYLPDINRALADDPHGNTDKLFPLAGTQAQLEHKDVTALLVTVGQSPDGHAAVEVGQKAYMAGLMDYHLNPDLPADQRYPHSPEETIQAISRRSGEVSGSLAIGMQEAVLGPASKEAKEFSDSVAQQKNAWSGAIGTGIGVGVSFIATPVGGAIAGGVAGTVSGMVLEHIFQQSETDVLTEASQDAGELWEKNRDLSAEHSQMAAINAAKVHGLPYQDQVADWALEGRDDGFNDAATNAQRMADHLTTEVPAA